MYNFFTSIEFYVIACVVAAAIVFFSSKPQQVGEARQFLLGGFLCFDNDDNEDSEDAEDKDSLSQTGQSVNNTPSTTTQGGYSSYPSNVSFSSYQEPSTPSIVEVTENGYRSIPTSKDNRQGKKQPKGSKGQTKPPIPGWITGAVEGKDPEIDLLCLEDGTVKLIRKGLNGTVTADGAVSLACTLIGFDLKIEERLTYGGRNLKDPAPTEAVFSLEFLAPNEHYHIQYNSETIHRMAAFTLATKEGMHIVKTLA